MSNRFEKIIATAIVAGALTFAGCSEEAEDEILPIPPTGSPFPAPGGPGGPGPGGAPNLLSARTIGTAQVELAYNEPMQVGNPVTAGGMFSLNRNLLNFGINFAVAGASPSYFPISTTHYYSFITSGLAGGPVSSAYVSAGDPTRIILNLSGALIESDDGATGKLRLTFTNGPDGVENQAGNPAPDIFIPPPNDRGNVNDGSFSPAIVDARTINATTVELTFSEPVMTTTPAMAAGDFTLTDNFYVSTTGFPSSVANAHFPFIASPQSSTFLNTFSVVNLVITPQQMKVVLTTGTPIPPAADLFGYIRLYYSPGASPIQDLGANNLLPVTPLGGHRGNVIDTL